MVKYTTKGIVDMMTRQEESSEFWMLTKGILQDSRVDIEEAAVIKRWLEEHRRGDEFERLIQKLNKFLGDGMIDRFESTDLIDSIGRVLAQLRTLKDD